MTNTEIIATIRNEIERLKGQLIRGACAAQIEMETNCKEEAYDEVLSFLDTLESEKPVPNDLEEAAQESATQYYKDAGYSPFPNVETAAHKSGFIAGAKWQKEKMMKEAVEGFIFQPEDYYPKELIARYDGELKQGDKVRIIIVKEEGM